MKSINPSKSFSTLGQLIYRARTIVLSIWSIAFLIGLPFLTHIINPFQSTGFSVTGSKSELANQIITKKLGLGYNECVVLYHSNDIETSEPRFLEAIKQSLSRIGEIGIPHEIIYPNLANQQFSSNKHSAYAVILFKIKDRLTQKETAHLKTLIKKPKRMSMYLGGEPFFIEQINQQTERDLLLGDIIAAPISVITLLIIFGSMAATLVPICLGAACAVTILTILYGIAHVTTLSIFTLNIALLLGLCLSLDYSLFIINRFREELNRKQSIELAIRKTMDSAGKAVFFSGLAVFISLSALLFFPINILFSIAVGGLTAVFIAVIGALTLLPAMLGSLEHRINAYALRKIYTPTSSITSVSRDSQNLWFRLANRVVKAPYRYFFSTLVFVLILAYTVFNIKIGVSDFHVLPKESQNQQFFDAFQNSFNSETLNPITAVVSTNHGQLLSPKNISTLYDWVQELKHKPFISEVKSIVSNDALSKPEYIALYSNAPSATVKASLNYSTREDFTVVNIISKFPVTSNQTMRLVDELRNETLLKHLHVAWTGVPVINKDVMDSVTKIIPVSIIWIVSLTYLILLLLLRSLFLPLKAIFMNALSLCASYGVLVFVFQEGHLQHLLNFRPQGLLDINLIVIIFCALFGFSMDYEVFLLTRIQEAYRKNQNNEQSIVYGIVKSSRIITSAALIVIVLCGSFLFANVLMVKEFGLGIAVAIFVDAFAIRTILVPATMALVKQWNWYCPKWLERQND